MTGASRAPASPAGALRPPVERILDQAERWVAEDRVVEVLTVDNCAEGPALYLRLERTAPARAEEIAPAAAGPSG